jgi:hypothetical protein
MSTALRNRLQKLLGIGALLGMALLFQAPSARAGTEANPAVGICSPAEYVGHDVWRVRCGDYVYCYQNNAYAPGLVC